jgi:hypothetical protein
MATLWAQLRREPFAVLAPALARAHREWLAVPAAMAWLAGVFIMQHRLPYGVSHTDEAFTSATAYAFLLGHRPYLDEIQIHQNAALLLVPFFWAYVLLNKAADGIVVFNRYLYLGYLILCSALAFRFVKKLAGVAVACCVGALIVTFGYANILCLSYNTCGALGFFCGVVCCASAMLRARPGPLLFAGCLFFLSAVFSYPGLLLIVPVYGLLLLVWLYRGVPRAARRSGLLGLGAGLAVGALLMGPLALWLGSAGIHRLVGYAQSEGFAQASSFSKLNFLNPSMFAPLWRKIVPEFAALFVAVPLACRLRPACVWLLAPVFAYVAYNCYNPGFPIANTPVALVQMALPVLAPACIALNRGWRYGPLLLGLVWLPSFLEMFATVLTSSNGYWAMSLGSLGVIVAGITSLAALIQRLAQREPHNQLGLLLVFTAFFGMLLSAHVDSLYGTVYDVNSILSMHDTPVLQGPFQGAIATAREADFLAVIDDDLKSVESKGETLTIFDDFATGYMSTFLHPRTFTPWIYWGMDMKFRDRLMDATFGRPEQLPDLVLKIHMQPIAQLLWSKYERDLYRPIVSRPEYDYVILQRVKPASGALHKGRPRQQHAG